MTAFPREIENNAYAKFLGVGEEGEISCIMGDVQVAYATWLLGENLRRSMLIFEALKNSKKKEIINTCTSMKFLLFNPFGLKAKQEFWYGGITIFWFF